MLERMIQHIDEPNRTACRRLMGDNEELFRKAPGSAANHQAWEGGYVDHLEDFTITGEDLYEMLSRRSPLPFTLSDVMLTGFLHDLEKPWKYVAGMKFRDEAAKEAFRAGLIREYGILLTPAHENALKYVHGEGADYSPHRRTQNELAAFIHCCDTISARIRHSERVIRTGPSADCRPSIG